MTYTLLWSYLFGWAVTAIASAVLIGKLNDSAGPQRYRIPLIVAAGIAWPLVVLGAVQMAAVAAVVEVARTCNGRSIRKRARAFADNELDDLVDEWLNAPGVEACAQN